MTLEELIAQSRKQGAQQERDSGNMTPGQMRNRKQLVEDEAMAKAKGENATQKVTPVGGGSGPGLSLYGTLLGSGDPGVLASLLGLDGPNGMSSPYGQRNVGSSLAQMSSNNQRTSNLQATAAQEQLKALILQNQQARNTKHGAGFGGLAGGGGYGQRLTAPMMTRGFDQDQAKQTRRQKLFNAETDRGISREDQLMALEMQQKLAEQEQKQKLALLEATIRHARGFGNGDSISTTNDSGMQYVMVGGRPVAMPTQSSSRTVQNNPIDRMALIRSILGG